MIQLVKPLRSGQITIPASLRRKLGFDNNTYLQIRIVEGELRIKPVKIAEKAGESAWFKSLYDQFSEVRKEAQSSTEKEIDQTIDEAVKAVRKSHVKNSD